MVNAKEIFEKTKNLSVLFVEDYETLRDETTSVLSKYFAKVDAAEDGLDGLEKYQKSFDNNSAYDIVITDIEMPNKNGLELITDIKNMNKNQVIVVLSAHQDSEYLLELINLGIKKFIAKPLVYSEFLHTIYVIAKELNGSVSLDTKVYLDGGLVYDRLSNILSSPDGVIPLTKNEITIMQLFTEKPDTVYSADEIVKYFEKIGSTLESKNIRNMIAKLRKKFVKGTIESIYGIGYRINSVIGPNE